jgi:hypothetical protein
MSLLLGFRESQGGAGPLREVKLTADSENLDMHHFLKKKKRLANKTIPSKSVFFALPVVSQ